MGEVSLWSGVLHFGCIGWPVSPQGVSVCLSLLPRVGVTEACCHAHFFGSGDPSSGSQACMANTLPPEPSLQPWPPSMCSGGLSRVTSLFCGRAWLRAGSLCCPLCPCPHQHCPLWAQASGTDDCPLGANVFNRKVRDVGIRATNLNVSCLYNPQDDLLLH